MRSPSTRTCSIIVIAFVLSIHSSSCKPQDVLSWSEFDLQFPSDSVKQTVLERKFQPSGMTPYSFDVWKDKLFFTLEGHPKNLPISVGFVNLRDLGTPISPKLFSYPEGDAAQFDWKNESKFLRVEHIHVDNCDRLWLLEKGVWGHKQPQLLIFDLATDNLIRKHEIPKDGTFESLIVDAPKGNCSNAHAYVLMRGLMEADKMLVYDFKENASYQTSLDLNPAKNQTLPEGCSSPAVKEKGVFSWDRFVQMEKATLLAPQKDGSRPLYFRIFLEPNEYVTSTKDFQNKSDSSTGYQYELLSCRGSGFSPISSSVFDENTGILFQIKPQAITCWNSGKHAQLALNTSGVYEIEGSDLRKIKVDGNGNLWIMTFALKYGKITYTMSKVPVSEVVAGTVC